MLIRRRRSPGLRRTSLRRWKTARGVRCWDSEILTLWHLWGDPDVLDINVVCNEPAPLAPDLEISSFDSFVAIF